MKHSVAGIKLLHYFANEGIHVFSLDQARKASRQMGISLGYVAESLHHLLKEGWIVRVKRGIYAFSPDSNFGTPPHDFEIVMALVSPCAISHWSAMQYHHLTQQSPNKIFAITPTSTPIPRSFNKKLYHFAQIKKEYFFGIESVWVNQSRIFMTDPERTLLDGLIKPQYCGDFQEVLHAFKMHSKKINLGRIIEYALKLDLAIAKRLGWILEKIGFKESDLRPLLQLPIKGYRKLDPTGAWKGRYNKKWMIQENIGLL